MHEVIDICDNSFFIVLKFNLKKYISLSSNLRFLLLFFFFVFDGLHCPVENVIPVGFRLIKKIFKHSADQHIIRLFFEFQIFHIVEIINKLF